MRTVVWGSVSGKVRSLVSPTLLSGEGERLWSTDCTCEGWYEFNLFTGRLMADQLSLTCASLLGVMESKVEPY
ncbi:uncharacterized protein [Physcomitrium patens]|uniref:Uncharacterized protein n=1 Tax=Physcomitrium patens TaxID=3218 RepID=A0A2K1IAT5_PHYPA|nr:hypothetical protein PHYPA_030962 [Physcomitrium patens]